MAMIGADAIAWDFAITTPVQSGIVSPASLLWRRVRTGSHSTGFAGLFFAAHLS